MKCLLAFFVMMLFALPSADAATPSDSVYQLKVSLTTQTGQSAGLDVGQGHPTLITMFYGSCPNVCPLLIETMQSMDKVLDANQRSRLRVLMVSIDPDRDTPERLAVLAKCRRVDTTRWTLARTDATDVRQLAAVLNVQYRRLPNGEFNHSSVITLLDSSGRIVVSTSRLGTADAEFISTLKRVLAE